MQWHWHASAINSPLVMRKETETVKRKLKVLYVTTLPPHHQPIIEKRSKNKNHKGSKGDNWRN
jgi:hypothetical protein